MAQLGVLSYEFIRDDLDPALDEVKARGLVAQFHFSSLFTDLDRMTAIVVGTAAYGDRVDDAAVGRIADAFARRSLRMAAVDGTYNMAHPDEEVRRRGRAGLAAIIERAEALGTGIVTLCTGTRDPDSMWRRHPDSHSSAAWDALRGEVEAALAIAEPAGVTLAFEPEMSNIVNSAERARALLDEFRSPRLKVLMDGANVFAEGDLGRQTEHLTEVVGALGADIALAHAKDLDRDGAAGHLPAGRGLLDYPLYLRLLRDAGFEGAVILHGLTSLDEADYAASFAHVRGSAPEGYFD